MVTKTLSIIIGVVYAALGVLSFFANPLIGATGYFASNVVYGTALIVVGLVLIGAGFAGYVAARTWDIIVGIVLLAAAVAGFALAPAGGYLYGFLVSAADNWLNVIAGVVLLLAGLFDTSEENIVSRTIIEERLVEV